MQNMYFRKNGLTEAIMKHKVSVPDTGTYSSAIMLRKGTR